MTKPKPTPTSPKPWLARVARTRSGKNERRRTWSAERWRKHDEARDERRENPPRPHLMALRLARDADREACRRRRLRLLAKKKRKEEGLE